MADTLKIFGYGCEDFLEMVMCGDDDKLSDASDIENVLEDQCELSDHNSDSELSESDVEETIQEIVNDKKYIFGRNRYKWCITAVQPTRKDSSELKVPVLKGNALELGEEADPYSIWQLLFNDDMLLHIINWTNFKINAMRSSKPDNCNLRDTDLIEMRAFIGLLIFTSIFDSNQESIKELFASDGTSRDIFRATMSENRFTLLMSALRFNNKKEIAKIKEQDPTADISFIFNTFIQNCQSVYDISQSVTVDEMIVSFRGHARFKMYMPNKPVKYGIKIMALTDATNSYLYNAYIYAGKDFDEVGLEPEFKKYSKPTQAVLRLAQPLFNTNRNITLDNWFSSMELAKALLQKGLTYVGTLKKNNQEIPSSFLPNKARKVGSTLYGFREDSTIISYVEKKNTATIFISTMHDHISTDPEEEKPKMVAYYLSNKEGVDNLEKKIAKCSSSRRTRRWSLAIFFRILDVSVINSFILHRCYKNNKKIKNEYEFGKQLARKLVQGNLERRLQNPRMPRELRFKVALILGKQPEEYLSVEPQENLVLEKRKGCYLCHKKTHRMTKYLCLNCKKPVCLQCSKPKCGFCADKQ